MNSFISTFRIFIPLAVAAMCIAIVELIAWHLLPAELDVLQSPLLHMRYLKPIRPERMNVVVKMRLAEQMPGDIIQFGESTGLAAVQPNLINPLLPGGFHLLNLSTQLPAEFPGFLATEEVGLRTHANARFALAFISPFHLGMITEGFGEEIMNDYIKYPIWKLLPSLRARALILNLAYYHVYAPRTLYQATKVDGTVEFSNYLEAMSDVYKSSGGWVAISMHKDYVAQSCHAVVDENLIQRRLQQFYDTALSYHARLILVLGPVRCSQDASTAHLERTIKTFTLSHPDVIIPMPLIYRVPADWLGDDVHLTPDGSAKYSILLAAALGRVLAPEVAGGSAPLVH